MSRLLLIRHGQSANNAQPEHLRVADPGLTELGMQQAEATAAALSHMPITHLYCSPFLRALETIRHLAAAKGLAVRVRKDIFEQGGCYSGHLSVGRRGQPGLGRKELMQRYPGWSIDPSIDDDGWWGRDYETYQEARDRAKSVATWISNEIANQEGLHVMVIHADFKALLVQAILSKGHHNNGFDVLQPLHNVGITEFSWSKNRWVLQQFNSVVHLVPELISC